MHRPNGEPVSYEEIDDRTPAEIEQARSEPRRSFVFGSLFVPTGPLPPAWLRRLVDRDWVPNPSPPSAYPRARE